MEKRLKRKFVFFSVAVASLVLGLLVLFINLADMHRVTKRADDMIDIIMENGGRMPRPKTPYEESRLKKGMSPEAPFAARYFSVRFDNEMKVKSVHTDNIFMVSSGKAVELARSVINGGSGDIKGHSGDYRYGIGKTTDGYSAVFVDFSESREARAEMLKSSLAILAVTIASVGLLSVLLSSRVVKPIVDSYYRQKRFITNASHDLKTPLAIINTNTELLELDGERRETNAIKRQIKRISSLIDDMLELLRIEENGNITPERFEIDEIIKEAATNYEESLALKGNTLRIAGEHVGINADMRLIKKLADILTDNAVKYSKHDTPIEVTLSRSNKSAEIVFENYADGLEPRSYDELFERFVRGDSSRNSEVKGHGIGLSAAAAIVSTHGGAVRAESTDGERIRFIVTLKDL